MAVEAGGPGNPLQECLVVQSRAFVAMAGEVPERQTSPSTLTWLRPRAYRSTSLLYLRFVLLQPTLIQD